MHVEVDRESDPAALEQVAEGLRRVLSNVRDAVEDWPKMRDTCSQLAEELAEHPPTGIDAREVEQARQLLEWLAANHFTFLGYREYALHRGADADRLEGVQGTGLGLLRYDPTGDGVTLSEQARQVARARELVIITKANSRATVHRNTYLDYVSVKQFDGEGHVTGEKRFLGLFTSSAYTESVTRVPVLRDKVASVFERSGFLPDSHSGKDLLEVLETYPRDELFQADEESLYDNATAVLHLQERRKTKLFLRRDRFGRFVSCLVYIPRDRYNTGVRLKMESILRQAFPGATVDFTTRVSESVLARLHFVVRVPAGESIPEVDEAVLERQLVDATRTWEEDLGEAARAEHGEEAAARLSGLYGRAFPEAYKEDFSPRVGVVDIRHMDALDSDGRDGAQHVPGARRPGRRAPLQALPPQPAVADAGAADVHPHGGRGRRRAALRDRPRRRDRPVRLRLRPAGAQRQGVVGRRRTRPAARAVPGRRGCRLARAGRVRRVQRPGARGQADLAPGRHPAHGRQVPPADRVDLLAELRRVGAGPQPQARPAARRAVRGPLRPAALRRHGRRGPPRLGRRRCPSASPTRSTTSSRSTTTASSARSSGSSRRRCAPTTTRPCPTGRRSPTSRSSSTRRRCPTCPRRGRSSRSSSTRPRVEGVHLRFGPVARGGLRWSDRREDFRTEVLGLVKAQMVKNAVIVPTGSKGGFYAKQLPDPSVDRDAWLAEGIESYKVFISGLLDLTDNRVGSEIVPPSSVVRHDDDDPYLVVAADKGTATFSDIANGVAQSYGFWLDDAFASGGSAGYDHKAMGITARGAWESVKRHFREMGVDTQSQDFTTVGIGDMSGDVFGNGMLLSEHIRLVAAFDHRHIFVDPSPEASTSYAERRRLVRAAPLVVGRLRHVRSSARGAASSTARSSRSR